MGAFIEAACPHLFDFTLLSICTLARPGAILALERNQCDLDLLQLDLHSGGRRQTKKRRPVVPLLAACLPIVLRAKPGERLVRYRGKALQVTVKAAWDEARDRAGLSKALTRYCIRHTMATELRRRGVDRWEVAGWLGHTAETTTDRYARFEPDYLSAGTRAIESYLDDVAVHSETLQACLEQAKQTPFLRLACGSGLKA